LFLSVNQLKSKPKKVSPYAHSTQSPLPLQQEFYHRCKGDERGVWFVYTFLSVITHFTSSCSANLL
jgi:hypothetical protein